MRITILGSGTSTGVPVPGCRCSVCTSTNERNRRLRTSVYVEIEGVDLAEGSSIPVEAMEHAVPVAAAVLIDTGPDFRYQALRAGLTRIDAVLYTHTHADHICGVDDLRGFNFLSEKLIPTYASAPAADELRTRFSYCFSTNHAYEGGSPPKLTLTEIEPFEPLLLGGLAVIPLLAMHGSAEVLGYRFGRFAYLTDCSFIPDKTRDYLTDLDVLVLDGLRERPHRTHFSHQQAVEEVNKIKPKKTYLTHISHDIEHERANEKLRQATDLSVECAYDGLVIEIRGGGRCA